MSIAPFNCLDPATLVHKSRLLEASAGTGKTFSIENIVTRLLIEPNPLGQIASLEDILVVTFTKAATRDLKKRIQRQLEKAAQELHTGNFSFPYLEAVVDKEQAYRRLTDALYTFDRAQIFTIHGFAAKMLSEYCVEAGISGVDVFADEVLPQDIMERLFIDFVHLKMPQDRLLPDQLNSVLDLFKTKSQATSSANFASELIKIASSLSPVEMLQGDSPHALLALIAREFQQFVKTYLQSQELFGSDALLQKMAASCQVDAFVKRIRSRYYAAIVDEFQDTDPLQWSIFQTLFKENILYLVGDPKQSIYGFRQADIYTYREAALQMGDAALGTLDTNFRSHPKLTAALNRLFGAAPKWLKLPALGESLPFHPVHSGMPDETLDMGDVKAPLHILYSEPTATKKVAHKSLSDKVDRTCFQPYVVQEIARLNKQCRIPFSGCAILVKDRYQADEIHALLQASGIPAGLQSMRMLNDSDLVPRIQELLEAVLSPNDLKKVKIALGGKLLRLTFEEIRQLEGAGFQAFEPYLELFSAWKKILAASGFYAFQQKMFSTTLPGCSKTIGETLASAKDIADELLSLQQLTELLTEELLHYPNQPERLLIYLERLQNPSLSDSLKIPCRRKTNEDAVRILTMHASKGLEFDIVFALGLSKPAKKPKLFYRNRAKISLITDEGSDAYSAAKEEMDAELLRQLYVVLTRAKKRVYIPFIRYPDKLGEDKETASPISLFVRNLPVSLAEFVSRESAHISLEVLQSMEAPIATPPPAISVQLIPPESLLFDVKPLDISSYSLLAKPHTETALSAPRDFDAEEKSALTLPAGSEIGTLLHDILEVIPFELGKNLSDAAAFVNSYARLGKFKQWRKTIAHVVHASLNAELDGFLVRDINPLHLWREHEFLFSAEEGLTIEGRAVPKGFLKGVIDLLFFHKGKYYLLDWKSNWLGSAPEDYSEQAMRAAMEQNDYLLQAAVYKVAMERFLRLIDTRPFEQIYGGMYYIFMRGLSPGNQDGILKI